MPMPLKKTKPQQQFQSNNTNDSQYLGVGNFGSSSSSGIVTHNNNGRSPSTFYANSYQQQQQRHYHHHQSNMLPPPPPPPPLGPPPPLPLPPPPNLQQQQQPPLITDTLTACLDVNGTYVCTTYSPRCYIIQKVTPTSVTVTPTQTVSIGVAPSAGPSQNLTHRNCPPGFCNNVDHVDPSNTYYGNNFHRSPSKYPPPSSTTYRQPYPYSNHHNHFHHQHRHHHPDSTPEFVSNLSSAKTSSIRQQKSPENELLLKIAQKNTSGGKESLSPGTQTPTSSEDGQSGRVYMNGEVGSSVSLGEGTSSHVGVAPQSQCTNNPGAHKPAANLVNGIGDGPSAPREQMALNSDELQSGKPDVEVVQNNLTKDEQSLTMHEDDQLPIDTPIEQLRALLLTQLEYYFSPENLSNDKFLVSQMDSDQYVYISTVANFNLIKRLSSDLDLITDVLKESKHVQVHSDGKRIRPVSNRTIVILRGIPENTPIEEIKALFEKENSPKCNNCEFAFNDSWYLSFDSDDEAVRAHRYLREDVREFKGQPIMARIKSRPTTLLAQGVGVNPTLKNGFNPPPQAAVPQYMNAPYVSSGNQPGPTAVAAAPIFAGQQLTNTVFTLPTSPYPSFGGVGVPWGGYYEINSAAAMSQIIHINGLQQPQVQQSPNYNKAIPMPPRHRNTKSETEYYRSIPRGPRRNGDGSNNGGGLPPPHPYGVSGNPHRKNSGPTPLLGMAPLPLNSQHHHASPHGHNHNHGQTIASGNSSSFNRNTGHYNNVGLASHNVPHSVPDSYYSNSRPYRGNDNRPRSSLGTRKPPRSYDDDANYENHNHNSTSTSVSNRGNPSARVIPPTPVSPQPPQPHRVSSPQYQSGRTNFDLESNAFPPLPGAINSSSKNGDSVYEGRLSDVVKGVKNNKTSHQLGDKEEVGINTVHSELLVSTEEETYVVSAASPTKELDLPQELSSQSCAMEQKKEFREVGVGSADDSHLIRVVRPKQREPVAPSVKNKETADKSTRTDTALLHGDQSSGGNKLSDSKYPGSGARGSGEPQDHSNDNYRKSVPQSTKSPLINKRGVPGSHQQQVPLMSTVAVGTEVPYSSQKDSYSPAKLSATSGHVNHVDSCNSSGSDRIGSGATYVAKIQGDNNSRSGAGSGSSNQRNLNTNDKEAFPVPGFSKTNVPTSKTLSDAAEFQKEVPRTAEDEKAKKDSSGKKSVDETICSKEDREGSVRLSYAQVAQSRKDKPSTSTTQLPQASSSSSSTVSQSGSGTGTGNNAQGEEKRKSGSENRDSRPLPKPNLQRGNSGGGSEGGDYNRGFRRYRNRISSEHSQDGGGNFGRPPRRARSPTK